MSNSVPIKHNISSMQVLKILTLLLEGNYTMTELLQKLNSDGGATFTNSVVSKYINTCRFCGIDISKIRNKYYVANVPFGLNLTSSDLILLENIQKMAAEKLTSKPKKIFDNFIEKLNCFSNKYIVKIEQKTTQIVYEIFEKAISEKRKIRLLFKNSTSLECVPVMMTEHNGRRFFDVFEDEDEKLIPVAKVIGIEILNKTFYSKFSKMVVIYKLKGELAKRYDLKEHEQLIEANSDEIVISNSGENKELLFSRLLRYDVLCEIISPKIYREDIKHLISEMLENYNED